jgi:hypothetical protein
LAGCCLFALLVTGIAMGRPPTVRTVPAIRSEIPTIATRAVTTRVIPAQPSALMQVGSPADSDASGLQAQVGAQADPSTSAAPATVDAEAPARPLADGVAALPAPIFAQATPATDMTMDVFLDRLMRAESGGKLTARSTTSSALGPFQFIDATFLIVVRRHFAAETANLTPSQILALRTDLAFSRRAAEAFTQDNASILVGAGIPATFQNLRLAYLLGPGGAIKVLRTEPTMPLLTLLPANVIRANSFMRPLTASGLIARAAREVSVKPTSVAGIIAPPATPADVTAAVATVAAANPAAVGGGVKVAAIGPKVAAPAAITVSCDLGLASCRKWLAMEQRRQGARARNRGVREAKLR